MKMSVSQWGRGLFCCMIAAIGLSGAGCDDSAESGDATDSAEVAVVDTGTLSGPAPDPSQNLPEAWLADRYGPESGVVELVVESDGEETRQVRYFADHGRREALYWYAFGDENAPHVTITKNDSAYFRGPANPAPQVPPCVTFAMSSQVCVLPPTHSDAPHAMFACSPLIVTSQLQSPPSLEQAKRPVTATPTASLGRLIPIVEY